MSMNYTKLYVMRLLHQLKFASGGIYQMQAQKKKKNFFLPEMRSLI